MLATGVHEACRAPLAGRVAMVTGAAGDLGKAICRRFADQGATVVAVDRRRQEHGDVEIWRSSSLPHLILSANLCDEDDVAQAVQTCLGRVGRIDILVNNAGVEGMVVPLVDYPLAIFEQVLAVNVTGTFLGLKHVLPHMVAKGQGSVINIASVAGSIGSPGMIAYTASKHAVVGLTRAAAAEAAKSGVRINCVSPGPIESRMMHSVDGSREEGAAQNAAAANPLGRYGRPEEVAGIVAFLASDESSYCNGGIFPIDGGLSAMLGARANAHQNH